MEARVTEKDLQNFAALGFAAPVSADVEPDSEELAESIVHVLQAPTARLTSAAAMGLEALASTNELDVFDRISFDDDVRRSLGYLAERVARQLDSSAQTAERLERFSAVLYRPDDGRQPPLVLMARSNPTLLRLKKERADDVNRRWNVFGNPTVLVH